MPVQLNAENTSQRLAEGDVRVNSDGSATVRVDGRNYTIRGTGENGQALRFDGSARDQNLANILLDILESKGALGYGAKVDALGVHCAGKDYTHLEGRPSVAAYNSLCEMLSPPRVATKNRVSSSLTPPAYEAAISSPPPPSSSEPDEVREVHYSHSYRHKHGRKDNKEIRRLRRQIGRMEEQLEAHMARPAPAGNDRQMRRLVRQIDGLEDQLRVQMANQQNEINARELVIARQEGQLQGMGMQGDVLRDQIHILQANNEHANEQLREAIADRQRQLQNLIEQQQMANAGPAPVVNALPQLEALIHEVAQLRANPPAAQPANQEQEHLLALLQQQIQATIDLTTQHNQQVDRILADRATEFNRLIGALDHQEQLAAINAILEELRQMRAQPAQPHNAVLDINTALQQQIQDLREINTQATTALQLRLDQLVLQMGQQAPAPNNPHEPLVQQLADLLAELRALRRDQAQDRQQLTDTAMANVRQDQEIRDLQRRIADLEAAENALTDQLQQNAPQSQIDLANARVEDAQRAMEQLKYQYEQQITELNKDREFSQTMMSQMSFQMGQNEEERRALSFEIERLHLQLETLNQRFNKAEIVELHQMIDRRFDQLFSLLQNGNQRGNTEEIKSLKRENMHLKRENKQQGREARDLIRQLEQAREDLNRASLNGGDQTEALMARIRQLETDLRELTQQKAELECQMHDLLARLDGIQDQLNNEDSEPGDDETRRGIAELQAQIRELKQQSPVAANQEEIEKLKAEVASLKKLKNPKAVSQEEKDRYLGANAGRKILDHLRQQDKKHPKDENKLLIPLTEVDVLIDTTHGPRRKKGKYNGSIIVDEGFISYFGREILRAERQNEKSQTNQ